METTSHIEGLLSTGEVIPPPPSASSWFPIADQDAFVADALRDHERANREGREQGQHDDRAEQSELFTDDREDEIGVRLGQEEQFLPSLHQAEAAKASG